MIYTYQTRGNALEASSILYGQTQPRTAAQNQPGVLDLSTANPRNLYLDASFDFDQAGKWIGADSQWLAKADSFPEFWTESIEVDQHRSVSSQQLQMQYLSDIDDWIQEAGKGLRALTTGVKLQTLDSGKNIGFEFVEDSGEKRHCLVPVDLIAAVQLLTGAEHEWRFLQRSTPTNEYQELVYIDTEGHLLGSVMLGSIAGPIC